MKIKRILTVFYIVLNIYVFCVGTLQGLLNYEAWKLIGKVEFPAFHQAVDLRIRQFFLPFFILSVPFNFVMIWFRHPQISKKLVLLVALINLFIFGITITLAIPVQNRLAQMQSPELIDQLVNFHIYLRTIPGLFAFSAVILMCYQLICKVPFPPAKQD